MQQEILTEDQNNLKFYGEKITLDLDNCEIKENNYFEDVAGTGLSLLDGEKYVVQTVIVYYLKRNDIIEKFVSQTFSLDKISLESHILNNEIILYVDAYDRNKYFFYFDSVALE